MNPHPANTPHTLRGRLSFASLRKLALSWAAWQDSFRRGVGSRANATCLRGSQSTRCGPGSFRGFTALDAEADLKGTNLVVSVVNGVAVIGGPVPSVAIARRAEQIVRKVEGMKEVRNTCFVSSGPDPLLKAVTEKTGSLPPRPIMGELPGILHHPSTPPVSPYPQGGKVAIGNPDSTVVARKPALPMTGAVGLFGAHGRTGRIDGNRAGRSVRVSDCSGPVDRIDGGWRPDRSERYEAVRSTLRKPDRGNPRWNSRGGRLRAACQTAGISPRSSSSVPGVSRVVVGSVVGK